jgi:hypothetical protein
MNIWQSRDLKPTPQLLTRDVLTLSSFQFDFQFHDSRLNTIKHRKFPAMQSSVLGSVTCNEVRMENDFDYLSRWLGEIKSEQDSESIRLYRRYFES